MNVLIKEINDIIEKNNSTINENIIGLNYLEKLKYLVIDNLKDGQDKFTLDDLVATLEKKNNQSIEFKFKNQSLFLSINLYNNSLSKINIGQANFSKGTDYKVFNYDGFKFGNMICIESIFPDISRQFVLNGADYLFILVNDGWYESQPEPDQHAVQAIFRSIENRRPVARCANTGISSVINHQGKVVYESKLNKADIINTSLIGVNFSTFYTKYGNLFSYLCCIILCFLILRRIFFNFECSVQNQKRSIISLSFAALENIV